MRFNYKTLAAGILVTGGFFAAFPVSAQSITLPLSQGVRDVHDDAYNGNFATWTITVPNQYFVGTTTGAYVVFNTAGAAYDRNYQSVTMTLTCGSYSSEYSSDYSALLGTIITDSQPTFLQLVSGDGYFNAQNDTCTNSIVYTVIAGHGVNFNYFGEATSTHPTWTVVQNVSSNVGVPYFAFVTNGFQVTPTNASSGVFFSGAVDYCNSAFASTTGIGATIGNGLCIASGFLFIPSTESYNQFISLPGVLQATPPISWMKDIAGIYEGAQASSTPNFINLSIDFGATSTKAIGIQKLDVISTTTISKYMPESVRQGILALEGAVFLAAAASGIYFTLKHMWKTT